MKRPRFTRNTFAVVSLAALAACGVEPTTAPTTTVDFQSLDDRRPTGRHVFVLAEEGRPAPALLQAIREHDGTLETQYDAFGVLTVFGLTDDGARELSLRDDVEGIDRDLVVKWAPGFEEVAGEVFELPTTESDQSGAFYYAQGMQWNIAQIQADEAWLQSGQGAGTVVGVLDSGVDPFHLALNGKVTANSATMLTAGSSPCGPDDEETIFDLNFHGTFVSGLITSNGIGVGSVAPDASILAVKVLNCSGSGSFADIIHGIAYAADQGADVINMSIGAYFSRSEPGATSLIRALRRAIRYADRHGTLVVASAGNDAIDLDHDGDFIHVPSQLPRVISVGATAPVAQMDFDALASYTNYGRTGVDMMAPGGDLTEAGICGFAPIYRCDLVLSAFSSFIAGGTGFYVLSGGTSFASPMVAGTGAVQVSSGLVDGEHGEQRTQTLTGCLLHGADDLGRRGRDPLYSFGRLNVLGALACGQDSEGHSVQGGG